MLRLILLASSLVIVGACGRDSHNKQPVAPVEEPLPHLDDPGQKKDPPPVKVLKETPESCRAKVEIFESQGETCRRPTVRECFEMNGTGGGTGQCHIDFESRYGKDSLLQMDQHCEKNQAGVYFNCQDIEIEFPVYGIDQAGDPTWLKTAARDYLMRSKLNCEFLGGMVLTPSQSELKTSDILGINKEYIIRNITSENPFKMKWHFEPGTLVKPQCLLETSWGTNTLSNFDQVVESYNNGTLSADWIINETLRVHKSYSDELKYAWHRNVRDRIKGTVALDVPRDCAADSLTTQGSNYICKKNFDFPAAKTLQNLPFLSICQAASNPLGMSVAGTTLELPKSGVTPNTDFMLHFSRIGLIFKVCFVKIFD